MQQQALAPIVKAATAAITATILQTKANKQTSKQLSKQAGIHTPYQAHVSSSICYYITSVPLSRFAHQVFFVSKINVCLKLSSVIRGFRCAGKRSLPITDEMHDKLAHSTLIDTFAKFHFKVYSS
uniref:Uncharacterized protein n=1 Tax=Glossina brevipalpis TaxID=37001 RepID=A0A1A9X2F6_9MUSC